MFEEPLWETSVYLEYTIFSANNRESFVNTIMLIMRGKDINEQ